MQPVHLQQSLRIANEIMWRAGPGDAVACWHRRVPRCRATHRLQIDAERRKDQQDAQRPQEPAGDAAQATSVREDKTAIGDLRTPGGWDHVLAAAGLLGGVGTFPWAAPTRVRVRGRTDLFKGSSTSCRPVLYSPRCNILAP